MTASKANKPDNLDAIYSKYEQASMQRQRTQSVLKASNAAIRKTVGQLLQKRPKVLLAALTRYYIDNFAVDNSNKNVYRQTRMRILSAVSVKNSGITVQKDSQGRVWLVKTK